MNKQILKLAIPNILSNLSVPLLGAVDTALMGHLGDAYYIGAIAIAGIIFDFIYWGFGFLRMGTTGLTAQAFGNEDHTEIHLTLVRALLVAAVMGILLIVFQTIIASIGFTLVQTTPEVEEHAKIYFFIRIFDAPATLALYAFQGWFLGMQNARFPLYITLLVNFVNITLNLLFLYGFDMKTDGIALGTLIAQYIGLLYALGLFWIYYQQYTQKLNFPVILNKGALSQFFTVNRDIFIRTLCLIFTFSFFTAQGAAFGEIILAANAILLMLWTILAYGVDGFAFAAESLVGKYTGQIRKNIKIYQEYKHVIRLLFGWGIVLSSIISLVYLFFGKEIIGLFTNNPEVVRVAESFMIWTIIAPVINSVCFIWDGIYIGATRTPAMRNSMLICAFAVFIPVYYLTLNSLGNHALWLAMVMFMIARGVTLTMLAKKNIFHHISADRTTTI